MTSENIVIDLSEHYGDVKIASPEDRVSVLSFWPIFRRHWLLCSFIFLSGLSLSALVAFLFPGNASYKATGKLLFQASDTKSELTGIADELNPLETTGVLTNPLNTQANLLTSGFLIEDVISNLELENEQGEPRSSRYVRDNLTVETVAATDILKVSFQSEEPQQAAQVVNELMRLYTLFVEQEQKAEIVAAKDFVNEQLPQFKADLSSASRALENFKAENQVVALHQQASDLSALMTGLDEQLNGAEIGLTASNAIISELSRKLDINTGDALNLSTLNDTPGIQEVLEELQAVETELAKQRGLYLPQHPTIVNLQNQAEQLGQLLQERVSVVLDKSSNVSRRELQLGSLKQSLLSELVNAESERILLETQLAAFTKLKQEYSNRALGFPTLERKQFELEQNLTNAQGSYNELLQRAQEIRLAEIQIDGSNYVQIIEEARPPQVVISKLNLVLLSLGSVISLMLSILMGLVLDRSDKTVKTAGDLGKMLDYPVLGLIPEFSRMAQENMRIARRNLPELLDIYRSIYSSLKVVSFENSAQVIAITSSIHKEGKSEVAANLAAAIAQSHRRVLLIDADLRTPVQHQLWQIPNDIGLSHLLSEKSNLAAAIHQHDPYLSIMTAGLTVADPSIFFESSRMREMLNEAKAEYEYIIFDASPILTEPDALLLGQVSEGIIFVSQPKYVQKSDVSMAINLIEKAKLTVMGLIINRVSSHEQKLSRVPFSHTYQEAEQPNSYQRNLQLIGHSDIPIRDSSNSQMLSNGVSKNRKNN